MYRRGRSKARGGSSRSSSAVSMPREDLQRPKYLSTSSTKKQKKGAVQKVQNQDKQVAFHQYADIFLQQATRVWQECPVPMDDGKGWAVDEDVNRLLYMFAGGDGEMVVKATELRTKVKKLVVDNIRISLPAAYEVDGKRVLVQARSCSGHNQSLICEHILAVMLCKSPQIIKLPLGQLLERISYGTDRDNLPPSSKTFNIKKKRRTSEVIFFPLDDNLVACTSDKMKIDILRKFTSRSDRVKALDFHPTESWVLSCLYNGSAHIWNYETQASVKSFEVTDHPIRAGRFIARKSWMIVGSDDMLIRVFNYNTHEKVITFEAHADYIRSIAIHPTRPLVLTSSDDMSIKLWDWENGWKCTQTFEGHSHYVMTVLFNPRDANTFASASLDKTVKVWSLNSKTPNFTLDAHERGVNCIDYYPAGDKPYIVSGADDRTVKIWDYQNKSCVQVLEGHGNNVTVVMFHPQLPIILTGSEDGSVKLWNSNTYRQETTLNYGLERIWCLGSIRGSNDIGVGCDEGTVVVKIGREEPSISMDSSGKLIWSRHSEVLTANVSLVEGNIKDGETLPLQIKEFGSCEIYPQKLIHSPNGRFVVVIGDGEYIIYTALAWRNKGYGSAMDLAWNPTNEYAIVDGQNRVRMFDKQFKEKKLEFQPPINFPVVGLKSGTLLGVRGADFLVFYDWETGIIVRRIDVLAESVFWNDAGTMVAIVGEESFFLLRYDRQAFTTALETGQAFTEEGLEAAFIFDREVTEGVKTGCWVGECFLYTNSANRLNYVVGGQITTLAHFEHPRYVLGYLPKTNRVYVCDKDAVVSSYHLNLKVIEYESAVIRGEMDLAASMLANLSKDELDMEKIARFLESQGHKELALEVSTKDDHRFDLALQLGKLQIALDIATKVPTESKWRAVGDHALQRWEFVIAEECMWKGQDLEGLLMLFSCNGDSEGMRKLAELAKKEKQTNVAFASSFLLNDLESCIDMLCDTDRAAEAALFARSYAPSSIQRPVALWKEQLTKVINKKKLADQLADDSELRNQVPDFEYALLAEKSLKYHRRKHDLPSSTEYEEYKDAVDRDILPEFKQKFPNGVPSDQLLLGEDGDNFEPPVPVALPTRSVNGLNQTLPPAGFLRATLGVREGETISESMSMEVNTAGTGSVHGMDEFLEMENVSETTSMSGYDDEIHKMLHGGRPSNSTLPSSATGNRPT